MFKNVGARAPYLHGLGGHKIINFYMPLGGHMPS